MPTVAVDRDDLFARLGKKYEDKEFDELCFQFGVELDDILTESDAKELRSTGTHSSVVPTAEVGSKEKVLYYIEVPANRYDLLCIEGIARAFNIFLGNMPVPVYKTTKPAKMLQMTVKAETAQIRPFVVAAVLRNVTFNNAAYTSFIDLQDKLHQNICRRRTLVAIGTHDLATLTPPFTYEARPPKKIEFVPLSQTKSFKADELLEFYRTDPNVKHLKPYVDIIAHSPVYPCIYDSKGTLLSLPPIINGDHSKISVDTKDVFIECTAVDYTKAQVVLNTVVSMFSEYCAESFTIEPVEIIYEKSVTTFTGDGEVVVSQAVTPDLTPRVATASLKSIASVIGVPDIDVNTITDLCSRMSLTSTIVQGKEAVKGAVQESLESCGIVASDWEQAESVLKVLVPPTRSDVLHEVDVAEDVAVAYGYDRIPRTVPKSYTIGTQLPVNKLTDQMRHELANAGYEECLTLALVSVADNYDNMNRSNDGKAVVLGNPQSEDFEIGRTTIVPGLLKSLSCNKAVSVRDGLKLFEISDVLLIDDDADTGSRNERHLGALYTGPTAGCEILHGLVDRIMQLLEIPVRPYSWDKNAVATYSKNGYRYFVEATSEYQTYFPGRGVNIYLENEAGEKTVVGNFGVLHPQVLENFELVFPTSVLELNIEPFV